MTKKTLVTRWTESFKNHWIGAVAMCCISGLGAIAGLTDTVEKISNLFSATSSSSTKAPTIDASNGGVAIGGNVSNSTVTLGFTEKQYFDRLDVREATLRDRLKDEHRAQLARADKNTEAQIERRILLERELAAVRQKIASKEEAFQELKRQLQNSQAALDQLKGKVEPQRLVNLKLAVNRGPDSAFDALSNLAGEESIAFAAYQAGRLAVSEVHYDDAMTQFAKAIALDGDNAAYLTSAGLLALKLARYGDSEGYLTKALSIDSKSLGADHPDTARSANNLGGLYEAWKKPEKAEPLYRQALSSWTKNLGEDHPDTARGQTNLGSLVQAQGNADLAESLYQRALVTFRKHLGEAHPETATAMNNLASLYEFQEKYALAEPLYVQAMANTKAQLGDNHPDLAISMGNLASLYESQEKYAEAEDLYLSALQINRNSLGMRHPEVAYSLNSIASLYQRQGRNDDAVPLYRDAIEIWKVNPGFSSQDASISYIGLARIYQKQQQFADSKLLYLKALPILIEMYGADHPLTQLIEGALKDVQIATQ